MTKKEPKTKTEPPAINWDRLHAHNPKFRRVTPTDMDRLLLQPKKPRNPSPPRMEA